MAGASTSTHSLARVNGIELAYQIQGSGKPLVLLHGSFGSTEMFGLTFAALAGGRQVIGVDPHRRLQVRIGEEPAT
jgi:pimeloyl-ACP methyl ester carboxylesterase